MIHAPVDSFEGFRDAAKRLLAANVPPSDVVWERDQLALFAAPLPEASASPRVPPAFVTQARLAAYHTSPRRWAVLYRVLHRLTHGEHDLLADAGDPDVAQLRALVSAVRHDEHRMHAFLRFRPAGEGRSLAWYEPEHDILELAAPFFARRFASMRWVILTPRGSAAWDGARLEIARGLHAAEEAPRADEVDELFRAYYEAIFNPARANAELFARHVPARFRAHMPETANVSALFRDVPERQRRLVDRRASASEAYLPAVEDFASLRAAVQSCQGCTIHEHATQAVFGEGPLDARIVLLGEQPGDQEDLAGHPFVGPAGKVLDDALRDAGIPRGETYVTNAVKHFKWEPRGKRRLHARPNPVEVHACRAWLDAELRLVKPESLVCLGATAARAMLGRNVRLSEQRGRVIDGTPRVVVTYHPSAVLRAEDGDAIYRDLVADLSLLRA